MVKKIKFKFNRTFALPKKKKEPRWKRSTYTDEELLEIRKKFNITPKDPNSRSGYPSAYDRGM